MAAETIIAIGTEKALEAGVIGTSASTATTGASLLTAANAPLVAVGVGGGALLLGVGYYLYSNDREDKQKHDTNLQNSQQQHETDLQNSQQKHELLMFKQKTLDKGAEHNRTMETIEKMIPGTERDEQIKLLLQHGDALLCSKGFKKTIATHPDGSKTESCEETYNTKLSDIREFALLDCGEKHTPKFHFSGEGAIDYDCIAS